MGLGQDSIKLPTGRLQFRVFENGELLETFDENNLVVDGAKQILAHLLGGDVTNNSVSKIGFGTSGIPPVAGNNSLTSAFIKSISSVTYPMANQVSFNFTLDIGEANGVSIFEFGLLTTAGTLFARKVRSAALAKTSAISIAGSWVISY